MSKDRSEFLNHLLDLFADLGPVRTGRMFGGTSLYIDDAMFGVIFSDALYMKADKSLAIEYANHGATPFSYDTKTGTRVISGLMSLPESALDDPDEALIWAQKSMIPAMATAKKRAASKRKRDEPI